MHVLAPELAENWPCEQPTHEVESAAVKYPAVQNRQVAPADTTEPGAHCNEHEAAPAGENNPTAHALQPPAADAENMPAAQYAQVEADTKVPGTQVEEQAVAPAPANFPGSQLLQAFIKLPYEAGQRPVSPPDVIVPQARVTELY